MSFVAVISSRQLAIKLRNIRLIATGCRLRGIFYRRISGEIVLGFVHRIQIIRLASDARIISITVVACGASNDQKHR
jgi:hypothetical protein